MAVWTRGLLILAGVLIVAVASADETVTRPALMKEPAYESKQPRYCLLTFGEPVEKSVWLVQDDKLLYVDRNGNGDLTEPDERVESESYGDDGAAFSFRAGEIVVGDRIHKDLRIHGSRLKHLAEDPGFADAFRTADPEASFYGVSVDVQMRVHRGNGIDGRVQQMANLFDVNGFLQFAATPGEAPIVRFDAPWQILLAGRPRFGVGRRMDLYLAVGTPGVGRGASAMVAYEKLIPAGATPQVKVTFPPAEAGGAPVVADYTLRQRCCAINFHGPLAVPDNVGPGEATVELALDGWLAGFVGTSTGTGDVFATEKIPLEPVSPRLVRELVHNSKNGILADLEFSPDGTRIIAGDYPGGVVQMWDVASGDSVMAIETGPGYRATDLYMEVTPDWSTLYVPHEERTVDKIEENGKSSFSFHFNGGVRSWDLASGQQLADYQQSPPTGVRVMFAAPDHENYVLMEQLSGLQHRVGVSIWNARTGEFRSLPEKTQGIPAFSADGRTMAVGAYDADNAASSIRLVEVASLKEIGSVPMGTGPEGWRTDSRPVALLDGVLVAEVQFFPGKSDYSTWTCHLRFFDTHNGEQLASIPIGNEKALWAATLSPDRKSLAINTIRSDAPRLYFVDIAQRVIRNTIALDDRPRMMSRSPAFSPDGRLLAIATQQLPDENAGDAADVADLLQPRIHLIEAATGVVREVIVSPQCIPSSVCFTPDGKILATAGHGRVLLWDVADITRGESSGGER